MRHFKIGDRVKVIAGLRAGSVTTVRSGLRPARNVVVGPSGVPEGTLVHELDLPTRYDVTGVVVAPPSWLIPYHEGHEKAADVETWQDCLAGIDAKVRA